LQSLIFDFDGLILDTEYPEFQSWQEIYQEHGCSLPLSVWAACIGTASDVFDPLDYLERQLGRAVDREAVLARRRQRDAELMQQQAVLPGVREYLVEAKRLGLKLGVASSSSHRWVDGQLARLGLAEYFDCVRCREDVEITKPHPALYLSALRGLDSRAEEAIALEDSPNGLLAARQAGIFCVVVPNPLTRELAFNGPDLLLNSLADLPLPELLRLAQERKRGARAS